MWLIVKMVMNAASHFYIYELFMPEYLYFLLPSCLLSD